MPMMGTKPRSSVTAPISLITKVSLSGLPFFFNMEVFSILLYSDIFIDYCRDSLSVSMSDETLFLVFC